MADLSARELIGLVKPPLTGLPACIAGSSVAAEAHGLPLGKFADVDVFCFSQEAMICGVTRMMTEGFEIEPRHARVWHRWIQKGMSNWHTNSIKMLNTEGVEVNVVYKKLNRHPLVTMSAVLESFDFGLLGVGYDLERGTFQDLRSYLFPGMNVNGPLPFMPQRRADWRGGFISEYQGIRELGRYVKYHDYGYDMSAIKDDLITGYQNASLYLATRDEPEKKFLSTVYWTAAAKLHAHDLKDIREYASLIAQADALDAMMDELE